MKKKISKLMKLFIKYKVKKLQAILFYFDFLKVKVIIIKIMSYTNENNVSSYIFTANNDNYSFKKVDGMLLSFPNNGSKWSLMKTHNNKYSWIPANDLSSLNINTYKFVNNQLTIDSCLFIIITFKITNIASYANIENKPVIIVSNNTDTIEYKLHSYVENNQLIIPFKSSNTVTIKLSKDNEFIKLIDCYVFNI